LRSRLIKDKMKGDVKWLEGNKTGHIM
jgi:hypothetical protein